MIRRLTLVGLLVLTSSSLAVVYCPKSIVCDGDNMMGCKSGIPPGWNAEDSQPVLNGKYLFSFATGSTDKGGTMGMCRYVLLDGAIVKNAFLVSSLKFGPDASTTPNWINEEGTNSFDCGVNDGTAQDPTKCPFAEY